MSFLEALNRRKNVVARSFSTLLLVSSVTARTLLTIELYFLKHVFEAQIKQVFSQATYKGQSIGHLELRLGFVANGQNVPADMQYCIVSVDETFRWREKTAPRIPLNVPDDVASQANLDSR
jgi:hypothetical protein